MLRSHDFPGFTATELAVIAQGELLARDDGERFRLAAPGAAAPGFVCVAFDLDALQTAVRGGAGLVVVPASLVGEEAVPRITVSDARLALAALTEAFHAHAPVAFPADRDAAHVAASAMVHASARLSAGVCVGEHAEIGRNAVLEPGVTVGAFSRIGSDCHLHAGARVYDHVTLGDRVILHSGCVIGADGFGFAAAASGPVKLHHLGTVVLSDDVEIGANSAVDRGLLGPTTVGARTKIDNHVQVGHNVTIGEECMIAGHVAIGGSSVIGNRVTLAGNSSVTDHVQLGDGSTLAGMSGLTRDLPAGEVWFGIPAMPLRRFSRRQYLLSRLEEIWKFVRDRRGG